MPLTLPNDIEPLTPADAAEVEQNYTYIEQYVNANCIVKQGTIAMTAPLTLYASPTAAQHAATKQYVDALLPVGVILPFGGVAAPVGSWFMCNGATLAIASYPKLYAAIAYRFGGSGGNFKLPNLAGRFPLGLDPAEAATRFDNVGETGGKWTMDVPKHHHSMTHDHGEFDSGSQSANHIHHMNHNHGSFDTKVAGEHQHNSEFTAHANPGSGGLYFARRIADSGTQATSTVSGTGDHKHAIDVPAYEGDTGNNTTSHTHKVNTPKFTGDTTETGIAAEAIPPYIIVTYIIRAD